MPRDDSELTRRTALRAVGGGVLGLGLAGGAQAAADESNLVRVNVGYSDPSGRRAAERAAADVVRRFGFDALTVEIDEHAIDGLRNRPAVRYVERDGTMYAIGPGENAPGGDPGPPGGGGGGSGECLPWGVDRVDADVAAANGETGSGADVAIIDTGIDSDHPDLSGNLGSGVAYVECKGGPSTCRTSWDDDEGHGTHCAGIAAAAGGNGEGVQGVAPEATLHAVKVLDKRGSGSFSDVAAGIEYTADQGWDVGSLSLGADSGSQVVRDACTYAYDRGVLLVAAAGNSGPCTDCVGYPAAYSTVVAVSATTTDDTLASYSSTGDEVEIAAPGTDVYSTYPGGYETLSGTSMACPHVSGAGGTLMADGTSNVQARDTLTGNASDLELSTTEQGAGLLDVAASVGLDSSDDGTGNC